MRKIIVFIITTFIICFGIQASFTTKLLPWPQHVKWNGQEFRLKQVSLSISKNGTEADKILTRFLNEYRISKVDESPTIIDVRYIDTIPEAKVNQEEARELVRFCKQHNVLLIPEIDMLHMWSSRGKPHPGIPVIDSRLHYVNHFDAFADLVALFNSNIAEQEQGSPDYAGAIIALWHDRLIQPEQDIILQNGLYPAALTLAERSWRGGGKDYFYTKGTLIDSEETDEYKSFADFEDRMLWHKEHNLKNYPFAYVRQTNVKWRIADAFPNDGNLEQVFPPEMELKKNYQYEGKQYSSKEAIGASIYLRHVWGTLIPSFYKDPQPNHTAYAWTWVYSPEKQQVGLWACTQNYSRSEKDLAPKQGTWDYKGSRIWLNDQEMQPPLWTASHTVLSNETPLGNENFEVRQPIQVTLQQGWNKVLLKLPFGELTSPEVRLQKWMFTFVFVTPDGEKAIDNIIYSPENKY